MRQIRDFETLADQTDIGLRRGCPTRGLLLEYMQLEHPHRVAGKHRGRTVGHAGFYRKKHTSPPVLLPSGPTAVRGGPPAFADAVSLSWRKSVKIFCQSMPRRVGHASACPAS